MGDFLAGLLGGLQQSITAGLARRDQQEQRDQQIEVSVLNHLAQTSEDPEVRALALSGLMEKSQGGKRGGILGLGRLRQTQSFQRLMQIAQRAGAVDQSLNGGGGPPPAPTPGAELGGGADQGQAQVVDRPVGTPSTGGAGGGAGDGGGASPITSLVGAAAQPTTSPTTGGPPPAPGASPAAAAPAAAPTTSSALAPGADAFGTYGPLGAQRVLSDIRGQETAKDQARYEAQRKLEELRQGGRETAAEARTAEQRARDEANWEHRDQQLSIRLQAMADRTDKVIAGMMARVGTEISARDKAAEQRSFMTSKQRLTDELDKINARRLHLHTSTGMTPKEKDAALNELDQQFESAYDSFYREIGKERPKLGEGTGGAGGTGTSSSSAAPSATTPAAAPWPPRPAAAGGPPSAPIAPPPPGPPGGAPAALAPTAGGPPGPPLDLKTVPNGKAIVSTVEGLKRQGMSPQQILAMAGPHLSPQQLQALKLYLKLQ